MVFDYMDHDLTGLMDRLGHNLPVTEVCIPSHHRTHSDHLNFFLNHHAKDMNALFTSGSRAVFSNSHAESLCTATYRQRVMAPCEDPRNARETL